MAGYIPKSFFEEKRQQFNQPTFANDAKFKDELTKNFKRIVMDVIKDRIKDMDYIYFTNITILNTLKNLASYEYRKALVRFNATDHYIRIILPNYNTLGLQNMAHVDLSYELQSATCERDYACMLTSIYGGFLDCLNAIEFYHTDPRTAFYNYTLTNSKRKISVSDI